MLNNYELIYDNQKKVTKFIVFILVLIAFFLHHARVTFGVNISIADFIIPLFFLLRISVMKLPKIHTIFFLGLSIIVIFTAAVYVPLKFNYYIDPKNIIVGYIKLIIVFLYFIFGYNLIRLNLVNYLTKYYSLFGLFIGMIGIVYSFLNISYFRDFLFYSNARFQGLMDDPNYFAILEVTCLPYILNIKSNYKKTLLSFIIFISVIVSGSKTGILIFFLYLSYKILIYFMNSRKKKYDFTTVLKSSIGLLSLIVLITYTVEHLDYLLLGLTKIFPSFERISVLLSDFDSAVSDGGSSRNEAWGNALMLIRITPIFGIGIGTYSTLSYKLFGSKIIAHNTYLQLMVEWGVVISIIFFAYIGYLIFKALFSKNNIYKNADDNIPLEIIIIMLIGSMGISLNNARMFWVFLGILIYQLKGKKIKVKR